MEPHLGDERTQNPQQTVPALTGLTSRRPGLCKYSGNPSSGPEAGLGAECVTENTAQLWVPKGTAATLQERSQGAAERKEGHGLTPEGVREGSVEAVKELKPRAGGGRALQEEAGWEWGL